MAIKGNFKLTNKKLIQSQIAERISRKVLPDVMQRVIESNTKSIARLFIKHLKKGSPVWMGVRGDWAGDDEYDIQAHLGVTSDLVVDAEESMRNAILDGLVISNVSVKGGGRGGSVRNATLIEFKVNFPDIADSVVDLSYESKGGTVPWMRWLLHGGSVDGYTIKFDVSVDEFSRTGRAIMVPSLRFNWDTSDYDGLVRGKDFIEEVIRSESFQSDMNDLIEKAIQRKLDSKRFVI